MTTTGVDPRAVPTRPRGLRFWSVARLSLAVLVVLGSLAVLVPARHGASYRDLRDALASGRVHAVRIEGALGGQGGPPAEARGTARVRLLWQEGWRRNETTVLQAFTQQDADAQASGPTQDAETPAAVLGADATIVGRVDGPLRAASPGVRLTWGDDEGDSTTTVWGLRVVGDRAGALLTMWAGLVTSLCLVLLATGPEPRWATPWAWTWLALSSLGPLAMVAYALVGARGAVRGGRRLGGWAAFLVMLLLRRLTLG